MSSHRVRMVASILAVWLTSVFLGAQNLPDSDPWEMIDKSIVEHLKGRDPQLTEKYLIQIPPATLYARWDDRPDGLYSLLAVADAIPEWGSAWLPTATRFSEAYGNFVNSLDTDDPIAIKLIDRYKNYPQLRVVLPNGQNEMRYPFSVSMASLKRIRQDGETQLAHGVTPVSWSFKLDPQSQTERRTSTKTRRSFFKLRGMTDQTTRELDVTKDGLSLSFAAYQLTSLPVTPGDWYSAQLVERFRSGKFKAGITPAGFWGPNGTLRLLVVGVVLVYKPQVTVTLNKLDYDLVEQHYTSGGSLSIGPFTFGGKTHRSSEKVIWKRESRSLTLRDDSPDPQIIAVLSLPLNYSLSQGIKK